MAPEIDVKEDENGMSSIGALADPSWLATYAPGNVGYAGLAAATVSEQTTLSALLAPPAAAASPFFSTPASLDATTSASATAALAAAEAKSPTLADQVEQISNENRLLDVLA